MKPITLQSDITWRNLQIHFTSLTARHSKIKKLCFQIKDIVTLWIYLKLNMSERNLDDDDDDDGDDDDDDDGDDDDGGG